MAWGWGDLPILPAWRLELRALWGAGCLLGLGVGTCIRAQIRNPLPTSVTSISLVKPPAVGFAFLFPTRPWWRWIGVVAELFPKTSEMRIKRVCIGFEQLQVILGWEDVSDQIQGVGQGAGLTLLTRSSCCPSWWAWGLSTQPPPPSPHQREV